MLAYSFLQLAYGMCGGFVNSKAMSWRYLRILPTNPRRPDPTCVGKCKRDQRFQPGGEGTMGGIAGSSWSRRRGPDGFQQCGYPIHSCREPWVRPRANTWVYSSVTLAGDVQILAPRPRAHSTGPPGQFPQENNVITLVSLAIANARGY